jgi:ABC-type dipeptide/oligopeptide/nickel transport system ATPase subunit
VGPSGSGKSTLWEVRWGGCVHFHMCSCCSFSHVLHLCTLWYGVTFVGHSGSGKSTPWEV